MKKPILLLLVSCCLILGSSSFLSDKTNVESEIVTPCGSLSGLSFYVSDEKVEAGETVFVPVSAKEFNVATFSWSMSYNSDIIRLDSVINQDPNSGNFTIPNFGDGRKNIFQNYNTVGFNPLTSTLPQPADYPSGTNKIITIVWSTPNAQPFPLNDCDALFYLCFTAIGNPGDISPIEFLNEPTEIDVTDGVTTLLDDVNSFGGGSVEILGNPSSLDEAAQNAGFGVSPNPFTEKTMVEFSLKESSLTQISVYDLNGKKIYEAKEMRGAGAQIVELERSHFEAAGIYFLKISTDEFNASEKLFLVR